MYSPSMDNSIHYTSHELFQHDGDINHISFSG
uniref:Uncharacterized protein n=1 Tax=Rhizophora mucronata TaxID=61149 RepID=A0A2P2PZ59_RHIMU